MIRVESVFLVKKISVVIPCYNDENSITQLRDRLVKIFSEQLERYDYEIIYVDDCSPDNTWEEIKKVCAADEKCKGIRNLRNFGFYRNVFAAMGYSTGDATFMLFGDIQDPPEYLPEFVRYWEEGSRVVVGQRSNSYSKWFIRVARKWYYKMLAKLSKSNQIEGISGFGLYDISFVKILQGIDDIQPILPGIISEYVRDVKIVPVVQEKGGREKSNLNFWGKYDGAMMSITSYTKSLLRIITFVGLFLGILSIGYAIFIFVQKILFWDVFTAGLPSLVVGMFFMGAVQLFFLGIIGEYVLSINNRSMKRPLVVVDKTVNYDKESENKGE
jgi:glycosyltransferase involved in cell wall biosynthesis